ncbi:GNAT family N-acetyltransferase [Frankia sp. CcI49]|uniref:GNAT family N-acetyltransferase n=1 Tax=Frankia sp. CcI49 TaxID=1745382 RepID=UPI0009754D34|nr:GNAT family N-acetyltransferase [Frankia sp. CcI49]ONH58526.1 GNAT family N-acetyltransferase [Frankia sp. CcI49]
MVADSASLAGGDALVAPRRALPTSDIELARELEGLAHRAWPPLRERNFAGWVLRESAGSSRRGNSVWARGDVPDLADGLRVVRSFYEAAGLPATFQVTPVARPAGLLDALDDAGYDDAGPTDVCVAPLTGLLVTRPDPAGARLEITCADRPDARWIGVAGQVLTTFAAQLTGSLAVLTAMRLPQRYLTLLLDGNPVGVGRGVLDRGWLGIYSMATLPVARGLGVAGRVLAELARWAREGGADQAYLQVERDSADARGLYTRRGFRPVYEYSYRRLPVPAAAGHGVGSAVGSGTGSGAGSAAGSGGEA